ncbi:DM13 domain-containing protein [Flavobacterium sp. D11R37]|uniref:DM13 domain-containing protein n=1 Tax=Flavobacterium coralii TaxID=2838017 RepID=UPI001CA6483B|nr:DM13 domain-containing protein [Flavobacterium coralii]MBY8961305.1 DM13 domain-containing protein [Flavobacterium coralii]
MKKAVFLFACIFTLISCEEEGELTGSLPPVAIDETATPLFEGSFEPTSGINATGKVKIYLENGAHRLDFEDLNVSNGPDLKVYLSTAAYPQQFVNLGNFNANNVYTIPQAVNVSDYSHVLIHCQQYNHLFAYAPLQPIQ